MTKGKPVELYVNPEDYYSALQVADADTNPEFSRYVSKEAYDSLLASALKLRDAAVEMREGNGFAGEYTEAQADIFDEALATFDSSYPKEGADE